VSDSVNTTTGLSNAHLPADDRNPARHHESRAATKDRAYQILRESGVSRSEARDAAERATESARRSRGV
jgi:hypothetical protein